MLNWTQFVATLDGERALRRAGTLLLGVLLVSLPGVAQRIARDSPVLAVTYDIERAKIAAAGGGGFWLQGGAVDGAVSVYRGLGVAASLEGGHASNIQPGINLSKLSYLAGPRYTVQRGRVQIFGEGLFGGAHGFDGFFPANSGVTPTANSYAIQLGGGADVDLAGGFGVRAVELDYVRTGLPNNGENSQNDLRIAFGLSYRFRRK